MVGFRLIPVSRSEEHSIVIGTTLGHYRILAKLGAGGMGEVYAAEDTKLQRRVALKLLAPDVAADADRLQRFQREARAIAALTHPNIVTLYSVEEVDGVQFLTMELVEGETLGNCIPEGGLPLERLLKIAVPLVDAVAAAHEHGIVHRDLKPANIMLASDGRVKVLDFGLAKLKPPVSATGTTVVATESLTGQHTILGTAAYMSPEQAEGRSVDHRSDIFSLGVILYELACGRRPFSGDSAFSVISSILKDAPPPLSSVKRDVTPALERIVTKALAKNPADRYQRACELGDALREVQEQTASLRVVSDLVRAVARSRWTPRMALASGLVAVVAGATWYWFAARDGTGSRGQPAPSRFRTARLTVYPGVEQYPSLLPDGKWVLYAGHEDGNRDVYLLNTSGQNPINLTADSPADDDEPAASPDGERIAFRSSREGGGIFVMGRTGERVQRVTPRDVAAAFNPTWSPDGTEIAYTTEDVQLRPLNWEKSDSELWVANVATGAQRKIDVLDAVQASWSPHGHRIAYVSRRQQVGSDASADMRFMDIHTIPARGGEPLPVTSDREADWCPVWSPDGAYLYFASNRGGSMNLWRIPIDEASGKRLGDPEPLITPAPFLAHPSISADGRLVAYVAKVETANIQKIALDVASATVQGEPTWVTTGSQAWANPDPTRDGRWIVAYTAEQPEGDLYIMSADGASRRQLTTEPKVIDRLPRWSPDQTWVAFFSDRSGSLAVWKIRSDGSGLQQLGGVNTVYPVWSPDGTRLAVNAHAGSGGGEDRVTLVIDANRAWQAQTPLELPRPKKSLQPFSAQDWSPDGTRLAGQTGMTGGAMGIVTYSFASRAYERLTDFGEWPVWLPDSRHVLFVTGGNEYWVVDTQTKQKRAVFSVAQDRLGPARLTRDGRVAFFTRRVTEADIYLLTFEE
jgi:Tol biopolymer transport system component/tRNA A-37 threonylcarbamoyl transferase component Bud32